MKAVCCRTSLKSSVSLVRLASGRSSICHDTARDDGDVSTPAELHLLPMHILLHAHFVAAKCFMLVCHGSTVTCFMLVCHGSTVTLCEQLSSLQPHVTC